MKFFDEIILVLNWYDLLLSNYVCVKVLTLPLIMFGLLEVRLWVMLVIQKIKFLK